MSNDHNQNQELNEEEREKLQLENEILKLKMQAQFGAMFGQMSDELTPEMEHAFLKNILEFEEQQQAKNMIKVYDLLGKPSYKPFDQLADGELKTELMRLVQMMNDKKINLHVKAKYEAEILYRFITEELFQHETDDIQVDGMSKDFFYEEFHPNHKADIEEQTMEFLKHLFEKSFDEFSAELATQLVVPLIPDPVFLTKEEVLKKMQLIFDSYEKFEDCKFALVDIAFQWNEEQGNGIGHSEGGVKYICVLENGEKQFIEGPFKIYFSNQFGMWEIFYFVFPGFNW